MEMLLVSVYDRVAEEYSAPAVAKNEGIAMRMFQGEMAKMPTYAQEDYLLMLVGRIDLQTGNVTAPTKPQRIVFDLSKMQENEDA